MKNYVFIGSFDKLDLLLYLSKIFNTLNKKIIIIDSTFEQKSRYIVPFISPTQKFVSRFENIDIAVGFQSFEELDGYMESTENAKLDYDYAFVSTDTIEGFQGFYNEDTIKAYFTTSFEAYSIKRGLEALSMLTIPVELTKIIFSTQYNEKDNEYLEYLSSEYRVIWNDKIINFPYNINDIEVRIDNEKSNSINMKNLSQDYKFNLEYLINDMMPNINMAELKKIMKMIEREG